MSTIVKRTPENVEQFKKYVLEYCKPTIGFGKEFEQNYIFNQRFLLERFKKLSFWEELLKELNEIDERYKRDCDGLDLLLHPASNIEINCKSVESAIEKSYRISILENKYKEDDEKYYQEFVLPENVFKKINDIIRTEIIVKYIDGINLIADCLNQLVSKHNYRLIQEDKCKEEGYYAKHFYIIYKTKITDIQNEPKEISHTFEIQVRTQLQDTIKSILHIYYEKDRIRSTNNENKNKEYDKRWRWQFNESVFITNYIGHILHFFDGLIVKIKNKEEVK